MKREIQRKISISALALTAAAMPFSIPLCHWSYLVFVASWASEGEWKLKWSLITENRLVLLFPLFFLAHVTGMIYTDNALSGWAQLEKKSAIFVIPLTLVSTTRLSKSDLDLVMRVFVVACFAGTLVCLGHAAWLAIGDSPQQNFDLSTMNEYQRLNPGASTTWMTFSYITLASGIGLHPTYFGLYLSLCLMIVVQLSLSDSVSPKQKRLALALFIYFVMFISLLSSRIAIIVAIAISLYALVMISRRRSWPDAPILVAALVLLAAAVYSNPVTRFRGLQEPMTASFESVPDYTTSSIEIRLSLLQLSQLASTGVNPWLGVGTGAGVDLLRASGSAHGISNIIDSYDPHNQFIYTFLELGAPGLLLLIAVLFIPAYYAWKRKSYLHAGFAMVFIAVCLTESALELQKGIVLFTFFSSLLLFRETEQARAANT